MDGPAKTQTESVLRGTWRSALVLLGLAVAGLAWLVVVARPYDAGSPLGYNLGLAGGLMMLALLLYPLRKRFRPLERLGRMEVWFRYHMVLGIGGPLLVLFHSTFRIGSMNARIALYSMILVASSGIVGRFLYRHLHRGLYGRKVSLSDAEADLKASTENIFSVFAQCPNVESRLEAFRMEAFAPLASIGARVFRFLTLSWRGRRLAREVRYEVKKVLTRLGREQGRPRSELVLNYRLAKEQISGYINAIVQAAQLESWERLFSLWHVVHIPFLYLLLLSGIVHVVAVHMY
jgi:hypothetical protein